MSHRATRRESSDPRTWSQGAARGTGATECLPGTRLPKRPPESTRCSSGPGIHRGTRFPGHPCATPGNCLGSSPASVSPAPGKAAHKFLLRCILRRVRPLLKRRCRRSNGHPARSGRVRSSHPSESGPWGLSARRSTQARTPPYQVRPDSGAASCRSERCLPGAPFLELSPVRKPSLPHSQVVQRCGRLSRRRELCRAT